MKLKTLKYTDYLKNIPEEGKHILAQYDDDSIIVYQAYRNSIAEHAVKHQKFGGDFSLNRMSWIKPNFLWMMYRCGWAGKEGQENVLAIKLKREGFDEILKRAVHSSFKDEFYKDQVEWKTKMKNSDVRVQWDPDHDPYGNKQKRKAIQLGLSEKTLFQYVNEWVISIERISDFVIEQKKSVESEKINNLIVPFEEIYTTTIKI